MNAQLYLNVTSRLAYYDAMKVATPPRKEPAPRMRKPWNLKNRAPRQEQVILVPENTNA